MASSPSQKLWGGMPLVLLLVAELPGSLHKCIFDEVQPRVRVVRAAPVRPGGPPAAACLGDPPARPQTSTHQASRPARRASPLTAPPARQPSDPAALTRPALASPQPIRIQTWLLRESDSLSDAEKGRLGAAVERAVRVVSSLLSVDRAPGPLLLSRDINKYCKFLWRNSSTINFNRCGRANSNYRTETCLDVTIPDEHLAGCDVYPRADSPRKIVLRPQGAGLPDVDFLLYLHIKATDKCRAEPEVLAYAVHCQTDGSGRPVAGVAVICRDRLTRVKDGHRATVQTLIHEMFHALGFSKDVFHSWRDCSSSSSQVGSGCSPRGTVTHSDGSGQMRIYTPSVISALQRHLASTDPELGGPLENLDAAPGGVSSHWEARVLRGSIMLAALEDAATVRMDPVTLAAFQDMGWYAVNLSRAQSLVWGESGGDMFGSLSTCQDNSSSFFCTGSGLGCHYFHLHKGECQTDPSLDGCRVYKILKNGGECWKKENGRQSAEERRSGEIFGFDSRCFVSSLNRHNQSQSVLSSGSVTGRCYRHKCSGPNRYQIQVSGSEWVDCPAGGAIQVKGYQGLVVCPDRRLCLYPDVAPPPDDGNAFPVSATSDPFETLPWAQNGTWSALGAAAQLTAATSLCLAAAAAVCLLAAVALSHRKRCTCRVRIHADPVELSSR